LLGSVISASSNLAAAEPVEIASSIPISYRMQRDHRLVLHPERYGEDNAHHVYLTVADQAAPYSFSLGWFVIVHARDGDAVLDEFGERLPMPGEKPQRAGFNPADLHAIRGFDFVSAGELKKASSEFEAATREGDQCARAHSNLGACLALSGQLGKAQTELGLAIKLKPDYALAYANRAWLALALKQPDLALADAQKALALQADLKPARLAAGRACLDRGMVAEGRALLEQTADHWSADPKALMLAGDALLAQGDLKGAWQRYRKAQLFAPNDTQLLLKLAHVAERQGNLDEALARARAATKACPQDVAGHVALGRYLEMNREPRIASIQFERALELSNTPDERLLVYGPFLRVLRTMNQLEEADKLSRRWLSENPQSADCHYNRAWIVSQLPGPERKSEAVQEYRKALALNPGLVQIHYNLGLILANQGKDGEAAEELHSFVDKAPQDPDVRQARELLSRIGK